MRAYLLWIYLGGRRRATITEFGVLFCFKCKFGVLRSKSSVEGTNFTVGKNWKSI